MKLGIIEYMDCAHYLPTHSKCGSLHGHTYKIELLINEEKKGNIIMDFGELRELVRNVIKEYDHRCLNDFLSYPSVENICEMLKSKLEKKLSHPFTIRVWEGYGKWAEL